MLLEFICLKTDSSYLLCDKKKTLNFSPITLSDLPSLLRLPRTSAHKSLLKRQYLLRMTLFHAVIFLISKATDKDLFTLGFYYFQIRYSNYYPLELGLT